MLSENVHLYNLLVSVIYGAWACIFGYCVFKSLNFGKILIFVDIVREHENVKIHTRENDVFFSIDLYCTDFNIMKLNSNTIAKLVKSRKYLLVKILTC